MVEKEDDVGCWDGFFSCFWAVTLSKTETAIGKRQRDGHVTSSRQQPRTAS
jgi:hypothetical protein